jgi:hypothetical protein
VKPAPAPRTLATVRALAIANVVALVVVRLVRDADDFGTWDLVGFLNANTAPSLGALLWRPEVRLRDPFWVPLYNVGGESVVSLVLYRLAGLVSLYWAPAMVLLFWDAVLLFLLGRLFRLLWRDHLPETLAWMLLGASPVLLTFLSTSAFNVQAYATVVLGLLAAELLVQGRAAAGTALLALAFTLMSQAYPIAYYLPCFVVAWGAFRSVAGPPPPGPDGGPATLRTRAARALGGTALVAAMVAGVLEASRWSYLEKISPFQLHGAGNQLAEPRAVLGRLWAFARLSFLPAQNVDGVVVGFGPYFLWLALAGVAVLWAVRGRRMGSAADGGWRASALAVAAVAGLVGLGYLPSFLSPIVKSQRSVLGDVFLVIAVVLALMATLRRGLLGARGVLVLLVPLVLLSDVFYLRVTGSVDHRREHMPIFDYDLSDGWVRHDLVAAIRIMRQQVDAEHARLLVYYPRGYSENTTDPGGFFGRFLRHFGRWQGRDDLLFACRWCNMQYGCPFPDVVDRPCAQRCCWDDPLRRLARRPPPPGRPIYLWWHDTMREVPRADREAVLHKVERRFLVQPVELPALVRDWKCYELLPRAPSAAARARLSTLNMGVSGSSASTVRPSGRLKLASSVPTQSRSSASAGGSAGSRATTNAQPTSPKTGSGTPTTAARPIFGWRASRSSTSAGWTL